MLFVASTPSWPNFTLDEFACNCGCGDNGIMPRFVDELQTIRTLIQQPFIITSGYRCSNHPIEAAKQRPGTHALGLAADIAASHMLARAIARRAFADLIFTGIGIKQHGAGRYIHLDMAVSDPPRVRPALWTYDKP